MSSLGLQVTASIADRWRELSSEKSWKGLLNPLDIDLRRSIINYGDRATAIGNAFNNTSLRSTNCCGFSRYAPRDFFSKTGIQTRNPYKYQVTDFIYGEVDAKILILDDSESTWSAYVAVATNEGKALLGRRDIVVSWRGTLLSVEWLKDFDAELISAPEIFRNDVAKMHKGFHSLYTAKDDKSTYSKTSARDQVLAAVSKLVEQYKDEEISITVTGHSLGAAIATLNALDIVVKGCNKTTGEQNKAFPVTAIVFASPRVGDANFKKLCEGQEDLHVLRVTNERDIVPNLPLDMPPYFSFKHVGEELRIDTRKSPYVKSMDDLGDFHNLELYIHGVAGTQGSEGGFNLEVDRDIALVNKDLDGLKDEYKIPAGWWGIEDNKGMVLGDDGRWKLLSSA
ncbi:PREDICTED: phospholipase A1-IIgamma-like [Populus euphratica]|uniref:Phospholipase A1 n=1 Tax=Populus euphratica TaxID=75702 RepID=A0AAJ6UD59_POPEU|nr:PREDICTED: phospholipase A1-IIgamma-like [Populus euphratica]XP_011027708.1 PREDICTED: phospholipase A1-IIgamma-like [Populus euphratica]